MSDKTKSAQSRRKERERRAGADKKAKSWIREWLDALIYAGIAALIIRAFFFEAFRIPTPSMEDTLLVGDFLLVSKLHYGPRTPMSIGIPFTEIHIPNLTLPWFRIPGFGKINRNDVFVFNYPMEDKVIAQKTNYIKRCVGLPGDSIRIGDKVLYVNGERAEMYPGMQIFYELRTAGQARVSAMKIKEATGDDAIPFGDGRIIVIATEEEAAEVESWPEVASLEPMVKPVGENSYRATSGFFFSKGLDGNNDQYGSILVPYKGQVVTLTAENWNLYRDIVTRYEGNTVQQNAGEFVINGTSTNQYTIQQDYYFAMGDNRDNSEDSRYWGFVPHDHVVGKAVLIYFSWDAERMLPRFSRMFNGIR